MKIKTLLAIFILLMLAQEATAVMRPGADYKAQDTKCSANYTNITCMGLSPENKIARRWQQWIFESQMRRRRGRTIHAFSDHLALTGLAGQKSASPSS